MHIQTRHVPDQLADGIASDGISLVEIIPRVRLAEDCDRIIKLHQESIGPNICRRRDVGDFRKQILVQFLDGVRELGEIGRLPMPSLFDDSRGKLRDQFPFGLKLRALQDDRPIQLAVVPEQSRISVGASHQHIKAAQTFRIQSHVRALDAL